MDTSNDLVLLDGISREANEVSESKNDECAGEGYEADDEHEEYEADEDKPDNEYEADNHEQAIHRVDNLSVEDESDDGYGSELSTEFEDLDVECEDNHEQTIHRVDNQSGEYESDEGYGSELSTEFEDLDVECED
ncbi:hypothetical protein BFJ66_g1002 [Fusarium oxysporum f. sp. cepae]|uniref:Uncharacterized protein n=1 Tax=Fusarium oxysporum f. sp. cepae TaxID=396571 RepID=A0A3L6NL24_FUSOX|nr:hypothetical protein BFJ65_g8371 [Fusarium oxysporum f. sp. cepae]RKK62195.1 hypothetical protein BFJ66_g1002 [Fusarium oxysporum f. sp. cepae]